MAVGARGPAGVHNRALTPGGASMAAARKMGKTELFVHFVEHMDAFGISLKRADVREFFDELQKICAQELQDSGEFTLPGIAKLVLQKREARMGRNPATGEAIEIPAKQVVKARIAKQIKDAVLTDE
jgi:DNA-binding protein HU-beta